MPEAKTIQELYNAKVEKHDGAVAMTIFSFLGEVGSALIGAQGRVVYTEEDVERCEEAAGLTWVHGKSIQEMTRAVITAAGGVVADEVVEVDEDIGETAVLACVRTTTVVAGGDKLYIVRAKEE